MPALDHNAATFNFRPSDLNENHAILEIAPNRHLEGHPVLLTAIATRLQEGKPVLISCTGRGVGPFRRKNPAPRYAHLRDSELRLVRYLSNPEQDCLISVKDLDGAAGRGSVTELDGAGEHVRNLCPSWGV